MLKVSCDGRSNIMMQANGNVIEMTADICVIINHLYFLLKDDNSVVAEFLKSSLLKAVNDEDSPLWKNHWKKEEQ